MGEGEDLRQGVNEDHSRSGNSGSWRGVGRAHARFGPLLETTPHIRHRDPRKVLQRLGGAQEKGPAGTDLCFGQLPDLGVKLADL